MHPESSENKKSPKTDLDKKFLYVVEQAMSMRGIQSDRAMSIELDRHPNFINRVRNGLQSAPPDAWDALFAKYPAARSITTNITANGGGPAIGNVEGDVTTATPNNLGDCQRDLLAAQGEIDKLRIQVAAQADIIAAKNALIEAQNVNLSLLRGGQNRPN